MEQLTSQRQFTPKKITEEVLNSVVHGMAAVAGILGLLFGLVYLSESPPSVKIGFVIYCASLILLMTFSSLYHALIFSKAKGVFQLFDHSAIYLLIAGSYTPITIYLFDAWQMYSVLALIWVIAITGIVLRATLPNTMKRAGVGLYIGFGWIALFFIPQLQNLEWFVISLLVLGGVLYTLGALIMALKKPFTHFGWHLMVVLAATAHYFAIINLVHR